LVLGDYSQQAPGAALQIEIGGTASGSQYDAVNVSGNVFLGGSLQLAMLSGFVPSLANTFAVLQATGSISGAFTDAANGQRLSTSDGLGSFIVNYGPGSAFNTKQIVLSSFLATSLPGDYNQNGIVDAADYVVWRDKLGSVTSLPNDDTPGVDQDDYNRWRAHFGQTTGSGSGASANSAVSEPATLLLLSWAAASWSLRRNRAA
jgi:hypothetical protein